ncbi:MAG: KpsF/GutQ family sugar-phosphate isomerase [Erysipelotrichaceae bacterium]|nr:KpsF/GutQ family sugar-phosphate isomerase [Erysipelotrichaceae bacterium]
MDRLNEAKKVFDIEIEALQKTRDVLGDDFIGILNEISSCEGKVILTGMGKPGHIAEKLAATFSSLGTPSFYLHPAEAMHGDLGMVSKNDVVIAISYSGESSEIIEILPAIKLIGAKLIAITGNRNSTLAKASDLVQELPEFEEACHLGLAPTSSTTVELVYGDALAVVASEMYDFKDVDFGKLHPAGALGKKLILKVEDCMAKNEDLPKIHVDSLLVDAIKEMTKKGLGVVCMVDDNGILKGILTDGDLRRVIEKRVDIYSESVRNVMTPDPKRTTKDKLAVEALKFIRSKNINNLPVVDEENKLIGVVDWRQIVKAGIVA